MNTILISFVIPTIKSPQELTSLLRTIVKRFGDRCEIIVVNDNPLNSKAYISSDELSNFPIIKIISNINNCGPGYSRNIGITESNGKYIAFVDDDDEIIFHKNDNLIDAIDRSSDIIFLDFEDSTGIFSNSNILNNLPQNKSIPIDLFINVMNNSDFYPWQCQQFFFKATFLKANNLYFLNTYIAEDIAFNSEAICSASHIEAVRDPYYLYRSNSGTLKSSAGYERAEDCLKALKKLTGYYWNNLSILKNSSSEIFLNRATDFLIKFLYIRVILLDSNEVIMQSDPEKPISSQFNFFYKNLTSFDLHNSVCHLHQELNSIVINNLSECLGKATKLYIYCAGPFGRAVAKLASSLLHTKNIFFIDDNAHLYMNKSQEIFSIYDLNEIPIHDMSDDVKIMICNPQPWFENSIANKLMKYFNKKNIDFPLESIIIGSKLFEKPLIL